MTGVQTCALPISADAAEIRAREAAAKELTAKGETEAYARFASEADAKRNDAERTRNDMASELANALRKAETSTAPGMATARREAMKLFAQIAAPFAPHVAEECWSVLGGTGMVTTAKWPTPDPALLVSDTVTLPVQINGKKRAEITVPASADPAAVEAAAKEDDAVKPHLAGLTVRKVIVVPGRIVNIVAS